MKNCVGENTVIRSVMNGISSEKIIGERYGHGRLIDTVAQGMDAMKFGSKLTYTKMGELRIGAEDASQKENLEQVAAYFDEIKMPYMLNVGVNHTCMAFETNYGGALEEGSRAHETMLAAMREVIALAGAEGIRLTEEDLEEYIAILRTLSPEGMPSMRQDAVSRRPSEVEMFAGTVIPMAERHGIPVPANRFLYEKIKEIEASY